MKRWAPWFVLVLSLCAVVFSLRTEDPKLLRDTDTAFLLQVVREVDDPMAWFRGDWPLRNHFYRPVSTLAFEMDNALYEEDAAGYGRTNALIAVLCVLLLFWFLREATDVPWLTGSATALFALWHIGEVPGDWLSTLFAWLAPLCLLGMLRGGLTKFGVCALAALGCLFLSTQTQPVTDFSGHIVHWLPGRTASVMTAFALLTLSSYARYARLTSVRTPPDVTAEDLPATKSTTVVSEPRLGGLLVLAASVSTLLALGSYEQAVMLPALLIGVWVLFAARGQRSPWWPHVVFWALLALYLVLRARLLPGDASGYQQQQFRTGYSGVLIVLGEYVLPSVYSTYVHFATLVADWFIYFTGLFWIPVLNAVGNLTTYWRAWVDRQRKWFALGFLLMSFFAFLPMAWLKEFGHYHYLPSAFRAAFVVVLGAVVVKLVMSAASLPELRAPARRGPALGSLPRP